MSMSFQKSITKKCISSTKLCAFFFPFILMSFLISANAWSAQQFTISLDQVPIWYIPGDGPPPPTSGNYLIDRTGTQESSEDACSSLAAGSLTQKVALIRRGTCPFSTKINNATSAGAVGAIIYNNSGGLATMNTSGTSIPAVFISAADGEMIDVRLGAGPVILTWTDKDTPAIDSVTSTAADGTYGLGSTIEVIVHFKEPISTQELSIALNTGALLHTPEIQDRSSVSMTYTVQADENTTDLTVSSISGMMTNASGVPTFNPKIPAGKNLGDVRDLVISSLLLPKTVTPNQTGKGTLSPATPQSIPHGTVTTFTVIPDSGYSASVGGTCGGKLNGSTYTTDVITTDCTVSAKFNPFPWPLFLPAMTFSSR